MELRRRTEAKLASLFLAAGGRPERSAPHYFVLGTSPWFAGLADDMCSLTLPLDALPSDVTSVTYPDSFSAMGLGPEYGLPDRTRPYHGRVYRLEELPALVATFGLPADGAPEGAGPHGHETYGDYQHRDFEKYIEIQLWSDVPLAPLLG
jgi:hypothetical protein